ncbi:hypothetical protein [Arthrobacter sp. CAN_A1]|uniref:hypothetical protein n=1 Tax=Arthrobacter sp. CAN_A1 TaxID=2787717 RepID=UPI0018CA0C18
MSRSPRTARITAGGALALTAAVALSGCTGLEIGDRPAQSGTPSSSDSSSAAPQVTTEPDPKPTVADRPAPDDDWVIYTDPQALVSFELPPDWTAEPIEDPGDGFEPESVHVAVENADGRPMAQLHTGIIGAEEDCLPDDASPYTVILSQPVDLPSTAESDQSIDPRLVVRLIEGFRFFSSYGITDVVGGADGAACTLTNTVQGPEHIGLYSFGDAISLTALTPEQVGSRTVSFETIADADEAFDTATFTSIRRMIASLQLAE